MVSDGSTHVGGVVLWRLLPHPGGFTNHQQWVGLVLASPLLGCGLRWLCGCGLPWLRLLLAVIWDWGMDLGGAGGGGTFIPQIIL